MYGPTVWLKTIDALLFLAKGRAGASGMSVLWLQTHFALVAEFRIRSEVQGSCVTVTVLYSKTQY